MIRARSFVRWRAGAALLLLLTCGACERTVPAPASPGEARIVSLVPAATEILYAIGAGGQVVGRSSYCDHPAEALGLPVLGDALSLRAESIFALNPTLILVGSQAQVDALGAVGDFATVVRMSPETLDEVRAAVLRTGDLTGHAGEARRVVATLNEVRRSAVPENGAERPSVLFVVQRSPLVVAGAGSYGHDVLVAAGGLNVAGDLHRPWPVLSLESLVERDPDIILDGSLDPDGETENPSAFWKGLRVLGAVRRGHVLRVREAAVFRPGPRFPVAVRVISELLREAGR